MKVSSLVFACHSKACAPPPVGTGGSRSSGGGGRKKISSPSAAYNEAKVRSDRGEKMTRGKIKEIWERNTTPGPAKDKGPGFSQGGATGGGGSGLKRSALKRPPVSRPQPTTTSWGKSTAPNAQKKGYGNGVEGHVHKDTRYGGYEARVTKDTSTSRIRSSTTLGRERFNSEKAAKAWVEKTAKAAAKG